MRTAIAVAFLIASTLAAANTPPPATGEEGAAAANERKVLIDIPAQPLETSLRAISKLAQINILFDAKNVEGLNAPALKGVWTTQEAVQKLTAGTGLTVQQPVTGTITVFKPNSKSATSALYDVLNTGALKLAQNNPSLGAGEGGTQREGEGNVTQSSSSLPVVTDSRNPDSSSDTSESESNKGIPEILVKRSRSSNVDVPRSRDGIQPYIVMTGDAIRNSGAFNLEEFIRNRLPMNVQQGLP